MLTHNHSYLLKKEDIPNIFLDLELLEKRSFYIIEEDKIGYDTNRTANLNILEDLQQLKKAYLNGNTIVVKNMENYNEAIRLQAARYGRDVDVCMFISPPKGSSFGFHTDEEDVYIHGVYGSKFFMFKGIERKLAILKPQDCIHIAPGVEHYARGLNQPSVHLSFGIKQKEYAVLTGLKDYALSSEDLGLI